MSFRKSLLFFIYPVVLLIVIAGCGGELSQPTVTVDQKFNVSPWAYTYSKANLKDGEEISSDIEVKSGGNIDVLLVDKDGLNQYTDMFKLQSLLLNMNSTLSQGAFHSYSFGMDAGEKLLFAFESDYPSDIYLMNRTNYNYYTHGSSFTSYEYYNSVEFCFISYLTESADSVFLVIDNTYRDTPARDSIEYTISGGYPEEKELNYLEGGLNVNTFSFTHQVSEDGEYYILINNSGNLKDGARPGDSVKVHAVNKHPIR